MSAIKAGDLVMVVKPAPCCGATNGMGRTFVVVDIEPGPGGCMHCWSRLDGYAASDGQQMWFAGRLIRIDPPALPESVETEREVTV